MSLPKILLLIFSLIAVFSVTTTNAFALGPLSTYCQGVRNCILKNWRPLTGFEESEHFYVLLTPRGQVQEIREDPGMSQSKRLAGHRFISTLRGMPQPPMRVPSPFRILVGLGNDKGDVVVQLHNLDWSGYMEELQRSIKREWMPPKSKQTYCAIVNFSLDSNGNMSHLTLGQTTGSKQADQAALDAVKRAAPFKPLLDGASESIDIEFSLDYRVHGTSSGAVIR